MSFAIIRTKKLKSIAAVVRSGRHTFREQQTPNADPAMTRKNRVVGAASANDLKARLEHRLPGKIKARSVLCIEYLITASSEAFKRHGGTLDDMRGGYFNDALKWLQQRHGMDNVISSAVHLDESTPHLVAYVVRPLPSADIPGRPALTRLLIWLTARLAIYPSLNPHLNPHLCSGFHRTLPDFFGHRLA